MLRGRELIDALGVRADPLLDARGFGPIDFARSHPGGALGRRLLLKVEHVMHAVDRHRNAVAFQLGDAFHPQQPVAMVLAQPVYGALVARFPRRVFLPAMRHRVILNFEAQAEGMNTDQVLLEILDKVPEKSDDESLLAATKSAS